MATYYSDEYSQQFITVPAQNLDPSDGKARLRFTYFSVTGPTAAIDIGEKVYLAKIPENARVVDVVFQGAAHTAVGIFEIGWEGNGSDAADTDGFIDAVDLGGQAAIGRMSANPGLPGFLKKFAKTTEITATATEATNAESRVYKGYVVWTLD